MSTVASLCHNLLPVFYLWFSSWISWSRRFRKTSTRVTWNPAVSRADWWLLGCTANSTSPCVIDIFLCSFSGSSLGPSNVDSARQNLAASFVNGFVNAAFGQDKLLMEEGNKWLYKNKEHGEWLGLCSVTGSLTGCKLYQWSSLEVWTKFLRMDWVRLFPC